MLSVDPRVGSGELAKYLTSLHLPIQVVPLQFGDMAFMGNGPDGCPVPIGVERKVLGDFVQSIRTGRLHAHQIPGLLAMYQEVWIIIEGMWRPDYKTGEILVPKGKQWVGLHGGGIMYRDLEQMIITLEMKCGVRIRRTASPMETCRSLSALYHWWVDKEWEDHRSHLKFHNDSEGSQLVRYDRDNPRHMVKLMAKELKGIGWEKSGNISGHFASPRDMVQASEKAWACIPGIGKTLAQRLVKVLQGGVG